MKIQLKRSNVLESGNAKVPTSAQLDYGELAVNYNANDPTLFLKDSDDNVIKFGGTSAYDDRYVRIVGDNMTGNLTLGPAGATNPNITLDASGGATFAGGNAEFLADGYLRIKRSAGNGSGALVVFPNNDFSANATAVINTDGSSTFLGPVTADRTGSTDRAFSAFLNGAEQTRIQADGSIFVGGTSSSAPIHLSNSGSADFTGNVYCNVSGVRQSGMTTAHGLVSYNIGTSSSDYLARFTSGGGPTEVASIKGDGSATFASRIAAGSANNGGSQTTSYAITAYNNSSSTETIYARNFGNGPLFSGRDSANNLSVNITANGSIYAANSNFHVTNEGNNGARMQINRSAGSDAFVIMDMSGNAGIQLRTGGTSTFRSTIQSGYFNTSSTSEAGCLVGSTGQIDVQRTSSQGNSFLFRGWQGTTNTCWIKADGSASFKSITVDGGSIPNATDADNIRCDTESATDANRFITFVDSGSGSYSRAKVDASLTYNSSTNTITAGNFNSTSDIALKQDITSIDGALSRLSNIEGVGFAWKKTGARTYGVIAQDVEKEFPELVHTDEFKTVNYNGLVGVLIEAIKELKTENEKLWNEINELKKG